MEPETDFYLYLLNKTSTVRLFIIGFKSSGKTTFGQKLARRLNMEFIDVDTYLEEKYKRTVPDIFTREGEEAFRLKEWKVLKEIVKRDNLIIATGGGAACHCENMDLMEKNGDTIYIKVNNETLVARLKESTANRPIVKGKTTAELRSYVAGLKEKCEHHYLRAKYILEDDNISVDKLLEMMANE